MLPSLSQFDPPKGTYNSLEKEKKRVVKAWLSINTENKIQTLKFSFQKRGEALFDILQKNYQPIYPGKQYNYFLHQLLKKMSPQGFPKKPKKKSDELDQQTPTPETPIEITFEQKIQILKDSILAIKNLVEQRFSELNRPNKLPISSNISTEQLERYSSLIETVIEKLDLDLSELPDIEAFIFEVAQKEIEYFIKVCRTCTHKPKKEVSKIDSPREKKDPLVGHLKHYKVSKASMEIKGMRREQLKVIAQDLAIQIGEKIKNPPEEFKSSLRSLAAYKGNLNIIKEHQEREFLVFRTSIYLEDSFKEFTRHNLQRYTILFGAKAIETALKDEIPAIEEPENCDGPSPPISYPNSPDSSIPPSIENSIKNSAKNICDLEKQLDELKKKLIAEEKKQVELLNKGVVRELFKNKNSE